MKQELNFSLYEKASFSAYDDRRGFPHRGKNDIIYQNRAIKFNWDIEICTNEFSQLIEELVQEYIQDYRGKGNPDKNKTKVALEAIIPNLIISNIHECSCVDMTNQTSVFKNLVHWMNDNYLHYNKGNNLKYLLSHIAMKPKLADKCHNFGVDISDIEWKEGLPAYKLKPSGNIPKKLLVKKSKKDLENPIQADFKTYFGVTDRTNQLYKRHNVKLALVPIEGRISNICTAPPSLFRSASDVETSARGRSKVKKLGLRHYARPFRVTYDEYDKKKLVELKKNEFKGNELTSKSYFKGVHYQWLSGDKGIPFSRSRLLINGIQAAELDFSCMFPRIIYSELEIDTKNRDLYRCGNYTDEEWLSKYRKIYKHCFNSLLNSKDENSFKKEVQGKINKKEFDIDTEELPIETILKDILEAHPLLLKPSYFYSGRQGSLERFYKESQIADRVLERYLKLDKIVLPMFDGFIVPDHGDNVEELEIIMQESYEAIVGNSNCEIKREY